MLVRIWLILAIAVQPLLGLGRGGACACREPAPEKCCCAHQSPADESAGCCGGDEQATDPADPANDDSACCAPDRDSCCSGNDQPLSCAVCAAMCRIACDGPAAPIVPAQRASVPRPPQPTPMPAAAWVNPIFAGPSGPARCAARVERRAPVSGRARLDLHCIRLI